MRIGITGAFGFIGKHLVQALGNSSSYTITPLRRKRKKSPPNPAELKNFVQGKDLIFHLGGVNRGPDDEILSGNILGTLNLLIALKTFGLPSTRLVFASSSQVYKLSGQREGIKETHATEPETVYGISKKAAEDLIRISGFPYSILRFSNVYGPGCKPDYNSVIATFCRNAVRNKPLSVHGNGKQGKDFLYIDDAVAALILAGTKFKIFRQNVYNVSSGRARPINHILQTIKRSGYTPRTIYRDKMSSENGSYSCDSSRFNKKFGWEAKTSLTKGIKNTLCWFQEKPLP